MRIAHALGMSGTFSPSSKETASYRSRHASRHVRHARVVMHVGIANPRWRGKRTRHCRRMRNPQFYVSGKIPMRVIIGLPWYHRSKLAVYLWFDNNVLWHDLHVKFWLGDSKSLCRVLKVRSRISLSCLLCHENATPESSGWNYEWCISTSNWYI